MGIDKRLDEAEVFYLNQCCSFPNGVFSFTHFGYKFILYTHDNMTEEGPKTDAVVYIICILWNCFYPVVHPSSHGECGVTPLPGCPMYSDAARYTCLSQNGYGLKLLIRTNIWVIYTMLVVICIQIF